MSMNDALRFIDRCKNDSAFRTASYDADQGPEFIAFVKKEGYDFTYPEIDDAFRSLKLKAPHEDAASEIDELKQWYQMMADQGDSPCSSCSTKTACSGGSCS